MRFLTVSMRLHWALHSLLCDVWSDVEVFELGVAPVEVDDQRVLLDDALLLLLFGLSRLVALLYLLDDAEGVLQVGGGHGRVAGSFQVWRSVRAEQKGERTFSRYNCEWEKKRFKMKGFRKVKTVLFNASQSCAVVGLITFKTIYYNKYLLISCSLFSLRANSTEMGLQA